MTQFKVVPKITNISNKFLKLVPRVVWTISPYDRLPSLHEDQLIRCIDMQDITAEKFSIINSAIKPDFEAQSMIKFEWLHGNARVPIPMQGTNNYVRLRNILFFYEISSNNRYKKYTQKNWINELYHSQSHLIESLILHLNEFLQSYY